MIVICIVDTEVLSSDKSSLLAGVKKSEPKEGEDFETLVAEVKKSLNFSFNSLEEVVMISLRKE